MCRLLVQLDGAALEEELWVGVEGDVCGGDLEIAVGVGLNRAIRVEHESLVACVQANADGRVLGHEGDAGFLVGVIAERQLMPESGDDRASEHGAVIKEVAVRRGLVDTIEEPTYDDRAVNLAVLEADQNLVPDGGDEEGSAVRSGAELHHRGPRRAEVIVQPGQLDPDTARSLAIPVLTDDPPHEPAKDCAAATRCDATPPRAPGRHEAEQRPILMPAGGEVRAVSLPANHVTHVRQDVLSTEVLTYAAQAHRSACAQYRIPPGRPVNFRES